MTSALSVGSWYKVKRLKLDDFEYDKEAGDAIYIPQGMKHNIWNPYEEDCIFIEVQTGTYFGEDDIVRLDDIYGRS